uniref:G035_VD_Conantokin_precursor_conopeptide n=1 Tax=Conus geographus TaxID=6491 RepID=X5IFY4_CONGE|nr:G035_VD_Conantokin_precursor_conopeptide [Conus geographus]
MHLYTYLYLLVPLVTFHLILGTGTLDDGGALTERRSADATALKAEPVLLQKSAARSTDDNGKDRLTQMKRILKQRGNKARGEEELQENQELIREKVMEKIIKLGVPRYTRQF